MGHGGGGGFHLERGRLRRAYPRDAEHFALQWYSVEWWNVHRPRSSPEPKRKGAVERVTNTTCMWRVILVEPHKAGVLAIA